MLALFDQHPGYPATDLESHIGGFRTFDRSTGAHRFGPFHNGWSSDLNRHGRLVACRVGFVLTRCEQRKTRKCSERENVVLQHCNHPSLEISEAVMRSDTSVAASVYMCSHSGSVSIARLPRPCATANKTSATISGRSAGTPSVAPRYWPTEAA